MKSAVYHEHFNSKQYKVQILSEANGVDNYDGHKWYFIQIIEPVEDNSAFSYVGSSRWVLDDQIIFEEE